MKFVCFLVNSFVIHTVQLNHSTQRFARRTRCGLATEIFPLAQNENSKKERTTYRKLSNEVLRAVMGCNNIYKNVNPILLFNPSSKIRIKVES